MKDHDWTKYTEDNGGLEFVMWVCENCNCMIFSHPSEISDYIYLPDGTLIEKTTTCGECVAHQVVES